MKHISLPTVKGKKRQRDVENRGKHWNHVAISQGKPGATTVGRSKDGFFPKN